ncbi:ribosome biogenesis GTPase Der [Candidatus Uhrbacteria bacterium]|nr:ribosome biogenesis GTPase Der [Candidatus Uhrbacteria bacterium]
MHPLPTIVIIGRRNVGKSALFNRLIEEQKAIVSDIAGTTRDRTEGICVWRGQNIRVVDTGGMDVGDADTIDREIKKQARFAIKEADLILFLVDARVGPVPAEAALAKELRRSISPPARGGARGGGSILLVANKAETEKWRTAGQDPGWKRLGFGVPQTISALTGQGVGDLLDTIFKQLKPSAVSRQPSADIKIAIIGKPNVGKSSLLNKILGEERVIVSPIPHTTREPQDTLFTYHAAHNTYHVLLIDTAGLRKRAKRKEGLEQMGVYKTLSVIGRSEVVIFVLDGTQPLDAQDKHLAQMIVEKGVGVVIAVNKWDLLSGKPSPPSSPIKGEEAGKNPPPLVGGVRGGGRTTQEGDLLMKQIHFGLPGLTFAPVVFISALTGHSVHKLLLLAMHAHENRKRVIADEDLKALLPKLILRHRPARSKAGSRHPIIRAIVQTGTEPPAFVIIIGPKQSLHQTYLRFIENQLRRYYDFEGTPIKVWVKQERG